jgi:GYF domain 2
MDSWYYKVFGDEFGPVTFDELVEFAKSHVLSSDDEVRLGESGPWRRAGSMGQLMAHMPSGAHLPSGTGAMSGPSISTSEAVPAKPTEVTGWYYQVFGEQFGPISLDDLVELAKNHTLSADDDVRFGENGAWRRAGSIGQLMAHLPFQAKKNAFSIEVAQPAVVEAPVDDFEVSENVMLMPSTSSPTSRREAVVPAKPAKVEETVPAEPEVDPAKQVRWWCKIQDKEYGPVELSKLIDWATAGRLLRTDYVRFGLDPYTLADKLPGLFPELPKEADSETKPEFNTTSRTQVMPSTSHVAPAASPSTQPSSSEPTPTPRTDWSAAAAQKPATNWQMNTAGAGAGLNRPGMPMGRPMAKSSSGSFDFEKIKIPLMGVGAIALLALLYFAIPYLPLGDSADVKTFKQLNTLVQEIQKGRSSDMKKDDFQKITSKVTAALKPIDKELKGKKTSPAVTKLKGLTKALQDVAKEQFSEKPSDAEKALGKKVSDLAKLLKVK